MGKYRKKPVIVDAEQWTGDNLEAIVKFLGDTHLSYDKHHYMDTSRIAGGLIIRTLEGEHQAAIGDWIIKGIQGEHYPCKPDVFEETYEPAGE